MCQSCTKYAEAIFPISLIIIQMIEKSFIVLCFCKRHKKSLKKTYLLAFRGLFVCFFFCLDWKIQIFLPKWLLWISILWVQHSNLFLYLGNLGECKLNTFSPWRAKNLGSRASFDVAKIYFCIKSLTYYYLFNRLVLWRQYVFKHDRQMTILFCSLFA